MTFSIVGRLYSKHLSSLKWLWLSFILHLIIKNFNGHKNNNQKTKTADAMPCCSFIHFYMLRVCAWACARTYSFSDDENGERSWSVCLVQRPISSHGMCIQHLTSWKEWIGKHFSPPRLKMHTLCVYSGKRQNAANHILYRKIICAHFLMNPFSNRHAIYCVMPWTELMSDWICYRSRTIHSHQKIWLVVNYNRYFHFNWESVCVSGFFRIFWF